MAGTINYLYNPLQSIWVIHTTICDGANILSIEAGTVIQVNTATNSIGSVLEYDVRISRNSGVSKLLEADVFATLSAATAEYEIRLT